MSSARPPAPAAPRFVSAKPVWPKRREREINVTAGFRAVFTLPKPARHAVLRCTGATHYRIYVNGAYLGHGPARGPKDFFRVDEWPLDGRLNAGTNVVAVEVCGYYACGYYTIRHPSFLQAEVEVDGRVAASTGGQGKRFQAKILTERVQKAQRYSFQRPFVELYRLRPAFDAWRSDAKARFKAVALSTQRPKRLIARGVPFPTFECRAPGQVVSEGTFAVGAKVKDLWKDRAVTNIGPLLDGYPEKELAQVLSTDLQGMPTKMLRKLKGPAALVAPRRLAAKRFAVWDFGVNRTGFIGARVTCHRAARVIFTFDELVLDGDVNWRRLGACSAAQYDLAPGTYDLESQEPYTLRALKAMCVRGSCTVESVHLREYAAPDVFEADFACSDPRVSLVFEAARETYRQNATDVLMDCPSRERAGWLCDSFFTARAGMALSGHAKVERNFLENYALPKRFAPLPDGMLPMCYPGEQRDGRFIPNWALWFVVELEEYFARTGDRALVDALKPRVEKLFRYFERFRNESGLLEKLESWIFVEWSKANTFLQDVNYPTNMVYLGALEAAGRLYGRRAWVREAERLRGVIRRQSFDGQFFVDNAVREGRRLKVTRNRTEVCQYYAFFFGVATPKLHPGLWRVLCSVFGPERHKTKRYKEIHFANAFIGNILRLEVLSRYGRCKQFLRESVGYYQYMAERTGTLWEDMDDRSSCNHGFAGHLCHALFRDALGLATVDLLKRKVIVRFAPQDLAWCEGSLPTPGGAIRMRWTRSGRRLRYRLEVPAGYAVEVQNPGGYRLERIG